MAGIGFVLRKLTRRGDLMGSIEAYFHAVFASTGPWILTIATMWLFYFIGEYWRVSDYVEEFRVIILYNFSFSLVLTAPLVMISTRFLADQFYEDDVSRVSSLLVGVLLTQFLVSFPIACFFYFYVYTFTPIHAALAVMNFVLISAIWLNMVFISSLKYYTVITSSFLIGMVLACGLAFWMTSYFGQEGMLLGFNMGLGFILVSFIAVILAEYPHTVHNIFIFLKTAKKYAPVVWSGVFYNVGIWVDKWIMWFAPERRTLANGMTIYPDYDVAMFVAYITIIPAMAAFMIAQETSFFEAYVRYFRGIVQHDTYKKIMKNKDLLIRNFLSNARSMILLQGGITFFAIALAPLILDVLWMNLGQLSMFRFGCLGAAFQILTLFLIILLSYFDARRSALKLSMVFCISNALLTLCSLLLGFRWYGVGYFLAMLISFGYGAYLAEKYLSQLTYHTFITRNFTFRA